MIRRVASHIARHRLIAPGDLVLVALSGGADSVALLRVLLQLGHRVEALHCNFRLRGDESDRDERFVRSLCRGLGVRLTVRAFDTMGHAALHKASVETAARDLRYAWFEQERLARGAASVAVAHHMDDQAETLLLHLLRGAGPRGLAGMAPRRDSVIRPLLCVARADITRYLDSLGQSYVTDSSNARADATRNKIRLRVMPLLRQINPSATATLARACDTLRSALPLYRGGARAALLERGATDSEFPLLPPPGDESGEALLHEWLDGKGFTQSQLAEMARADGAATGRAWASATHRVLRDRGRLLLETLGEERPAPALIEETVEAITDRDPRLAYLDADKLRAPLRLRPARTGDWFVPLGMTGRKLVSDFLTDRKRTLFQKERQMVVTCGADIVWVAGLRSDQRYRVTEETRRITRLSLKE